ARSLLAQTQVHCLFPTRAAFPEHPPNHDPPDNRLRSSGHIHLYSVAPVRWRDYLSFVGETVPIRGTIQYQDRPAMPPAAIIKIEPCRPHLRCGDDLNRLRCFAQSVPISYHIPYSVWHFMKLEVENSR